MPDKRVPLEDRHPPVAWVTRRFEFHMDAQRELVRDASRLSELDDQHFSVDTLAAIKDLPPEKQAELNRYIDERIATARAGDPPEGTDDRPNGSGFEFEIELGRVQAIVGDRHFVSAFLRELDHRASGPRRKTIVLNSFLAMAIGAFEVLIAGIATRFYIAHPDAIDDGQKVFSLSEIRKFEDLDDAADSRIASRIAALMYEGIDEWAKWFKANCQADFDALAMNLASIQEGFQRRHIVLHNGGLVSRQYLSRLGEGAPAGLSPGDRLPVDEEYLSQIFDELDVLGSSIGTLAWGTWNPDAGDLAAGALLQRSYELMVQQRWRPALGLSRLGERLKCASAIKTALRCNAWLSRAEIDGLEAIKSDVEDWDTSALAPRFQVVQLILVGETGRALERVPELLKAEELTLGELAEWPVMRTVREHPDFEATLKGLDEGSEGR